MRGHLFGVVCAVLLVAPVPAVAAVVLATVVRPPMYTPRICVYAEGSKVHSCPVTGTGPQYAIGHPCYCGNSPKGIIRAAPLTLAPN